MLFDSHCHLNFPDLESNLAGVLEMAKESGVREIVCVGTTVEDSERAVEIAKKNEGIYASVGVHPHETIKVDWDKFESLLKDPEVVAIGECGLDYSRIPSQGRQEEISRQRELFEKQIDLASQYNLPLIIHARDCYEDMIHDFGQKLANLRGVFHCFSGTMSYAQFVLDKLPGFYLSYAGNITFKNAQNIRDLAKITPLPRLMVETDAPFLSPEPRRGLGNVPANVKIVAQRLAEIKVVSFEEIAEATTQNARQLFKR
jgi:TatD DNase family protein